MSAERIEPGPALLDRVLELPSVSSLPRRNIARCAPHIDGLRLEAGDRLYDGQAPAGHFYWVLEGDVALSGKAGEQLARPGQTFGEESLDDDGVYAQSAQASTGATVARLPAERARELFAGSTQGLLASLVGRLTGRMRNPSARPQSTEGQAKGDWFRVVGWVTTILVPPVFYFWARGGIADGNQLLFLCIALTTILMWGFRLLNEFIPSIFAILSILILNIAPADVALVGFTDGSFYLALSIFGLSSLIVSSGLAFRMVLWMLRAVPVSSRWHALSFFVIGTILTPLLPSANGRVALMMPVLKDLVDASGYKKGSRSATYLFSAGFAGFTMLSTIFLSSKTIHFVIFGLLPQQVKERFSWGFWLLASLMAGLVLIVGIVVLLEVFSKGKEPPQIQRADINLQYRAFGRMGLGEWAALGGILLFIVGISTASLHKIQLPWIGLLVLYATLSVGFLTPKEFRTSIDWSFLLYLGSLIGFVSTISYLGIDRQAGQSLAWMGNYMKNQFSVFVLILTVTVVFMRFFVPTNTVVAILASVLFPMAQALGVNPWIVGFILLMLSDVWFFPYQCTYYVQIEPFVQEDSHFDLKRFYMFNAVSNGLRVLAIFASIPLWRWLGLL